MKEMFKNIQKQLSVDNSASCNGESIPLGFFEVYDEITKTLYRLESTERDENGRPIILYYQFEKFMLKIALEQEKALRKKHKKYSTHGKRSNNSASKI